MQAAFFLGVTAMPFGQVPDGPRVDCATMDQEAEAFLDVFTVKGAEQSLGEERAIVTVLPLPVLSEATVAEQAAGIAPSIPLAEPVEKSLAVTAAPDQTLPSGDIQPPSKEPPVSGEAKFEWLQSDLMQPAVVSLNTVELIFASNAAVLLQQASVDAPKTSDEGFVDLLEPRHHLVDMEAPDLAVSAGIKPVSAVDTFSKVIPPLDMHFQHVNTAADISPSEQPSPQIIGTNAQNLPLQPVLKTPVWPALSSAQTTSHLTTRAPDDHALVLDAPAKVQVNPDPAFTPTAEQSPKAASATAKVEGPAHPTQGPAPVTAAPTRQTPKPVEPDHLFQPNLALPTTVRLTSVAAKAPSDAKSQAKSVAPTHHRPIESMPLPTPGAQSVKADQVVKTDTDDAIQASGVALKIALPSRQLSTSSQLVEINVEEAAQHPATVENAFHLRLGLENGAMLISEANRPLAADFQSALDSDGLEPLPISRLVQSKADNQQIEMPAKSVQDLATPSPDLEQPAELQTDAGTEKAPERVVLVINTEADLATTNTVATNLTANPVNAPIPVAAPPTSDPVLTKPIEAPSPAQQTAAILANHNPTQTGTIEITLTPETLGRLHFEMQPEGDAMAITLSAERPETLDLMRRNLSDLIAELKQAGIQAGTLSFGTWSEGRNAPPTPPQISDETAVFDATPNRPNPTPLRPVLAAVGGLDLRI